MSDKMLTFEEKQRIARAPITVGILGTLTSRRITSMQHAGIGYRPSVSLYDEQGYKTGSRALQLSSGEGLV